MSREPIKILHTADFHLGARMGSIVPPSVEDSRREDFYRNMFYIADYAVKNKVDIVIISGDIFNRPDPAGKDFVAFSEFVGKIVSSGIYVVVIAGNHDKPKTTGARNPLEGLQKANLPYFWYFKHTPDEPLVLSIRGRKIGIAAIPYIDPKIVKLEIEISYENLIKRLVGRFVEKLRGINVDYKILMAHLLLAEAKFAEIFPIYSTEPRISRRTLQEEFFDYIALGHIHRPQKIGEKIYYSGSIEKIAFDEAPEQKSFYIIELSDGEVSVERVPLKCRPMIVQQLELLNASRSDFIRSIHALSGIPVGALLKLIIRSDEETLRSIVDKYWPEAQEILFKEKKIVGYCLKKIKIGAATSKPISPEIRGVRQKVLEYIDRLQASSKVKERAKEIAKNIMDEVGLP